MQRVLILVSTADDLHVDRCPIPSNEINDYRINSYVPRDGSERACVLSYGGKNNDNKLMNFYV